MSTQHASGDRFGRRRFLGWPRTGLGWWAVALGLGFFFFLAFLFMGLAAGQNGGDHFFHNPWLAYSLLSSAASAICGGITAATAIARKCERSIVLFLIVLLAAFVIYFAVGEMTESRSHSNSASAS
jgi:hypothetical protein